MVYIVKWVLVLFVTVNNCQIRAISSHSVTFRNRVQCDSFATILNTNRPEAGYGDYVDSVRIDSSLFAPMSVDYIKQDTVCN